MAGDHHSVFLAETLAALTPEGRVRVDQLLDELADAGRNRGELVRFARIREAEADMGHPDPEPDPELTKRELDELLAGFMEIRDREPLDDVSNWANAVVALLEDEAGHTAG